MMANLSIIYVLPNCVADICIEMKRITSKLYNMSASIALIKKALFVDVIPKFAIVIGQFINETDSLTASRKLMKSHLTKHIQDLYNLSIQNNDLKSLLYYIGTIVTILVLYLVTHLLTSDGDHYQNVTIHLLERKIKR